MDEEIPEFACKDGLEVYKLLVSEGRITDEDLADETGLFLDTVRGILYKMHEIGLAGCKMEKYKKTGFYDCVWSLTG